MNRVICRRRCRRQLGERREKFIQRTDNSARIADETIAYRDVTIAKPLRWNRPFFTRDDGKRKRVTR